MMIKVDMWKHLKMGVVSSLVLMSFAVSAGTQSGKVVYLLVHDNPNGTEKFDVKLDGAVSADQCSDVGWSQDLTSSVGKAQYATVLAAYLANREITIQGNGPNTCYTNRELIRNVYFVSP
jgi:hypothetical protein